MSDQPSEQSSFNPGDVTPEQFVALVGESSDEQIAQGLNQHRELVLDGIFTGMQEHFEADKAEGLEAIVEWRITEGPDGGTDRWQVAISNKSCAVEREGTQTPTISMEMNALDFVKIAAQKVAGPELFMSGRLKVEGDLMLAARLQGLFNVPKPEPQTPPSEPSSEGSGEQSPNT